MSEAIVSADELVVKYGDRAVLDHASLVIHEGERVGMVGRNGSGKSTFLKIAAGALEPDAGRLVRRRDLAVGYLPQVFDLADDRSVHENILDGARHLIHWIREYEAAPSDSARSAALLVQIEHADGWNIEHRIKSLVTHLHAPEGGRLVGSLSGGEKRRVALCRALLARPDFLILDEPTNHLDTESIEWLEEFLSKYPGACLFVTHDRYFLDRIATRIVEVANGNFFGHDGNYTDYLLSKAVRTAVEEGQERRRQKFLKNEIEWIRRAPRARRTKSQDRIDRYYETTAQAAPEKELDVEMVIPPAPKLANRVIELKNVSAEIGGRVLFHDVNFSLEAGARIGIVGRNGIGKSTLLRIMLGELQPATGRVEVGARTEINYIDQNRVQLDDSKTVFEEVGGNSEYVRLGEESITLRAYLRRFLFNEDRINTKIELLSGGERSRVILAKILKRGGNVLILDEPTNDLDLATLRLLEEALVAFEGAVLVVSHDRYFLNRVCTGILSFEGEGRVTQHVGNYDYYLEKKAERDLLASQAAVMPPVEPAPGRAADRTARPRKLSYKEARELGTMEADILAAEEEVARIEAIFNAPDFYQKHGDQWQQLDADLKSGRHRIAQLYARWEELEALGAG
jgi:ATP-binding cassette subfamily F protein uup